MNRDRLERLAGMLENYQHHENGTRFNLRYWGEFIERRTGFLWLRKQQCHTAACAVGLACLSSEFQNEGLSYQPAFFDGVIEPVFAGNTGWAAARAFFGLTDKQVIHLFEIGSYRDGPVGGEDGAKRVASRIRKMIAPRKRRAKPVSGAPQVFTEILDRENKKCRVPVSDHQL